MQKYPLNDYEKQQTSITVISLTESLPKIVLFNKHRVDGIVLTVRGGNKKAMTLPAFKRVRI